MYRNCALLLALVISVSGCGAYAMSPVTGFLYSDLTGPSTATANAVGQRMGEASCQSILGLIAQGDCSIATAARNGGITRISHVDHQTTSILGIVATFTVRVYGE